MLTRIVPSKSLSFKNSRGEWTYSTSGAWTGSANFSYSGSGITHVGTSNDAIHSVIALQNDFVVQCTDASASAYTHFGVFPIEEIASFNPSEFRGGCAGMTNPYYFQRASGGYYPVFDGYSVGSIIASASIGTVLAIQRTGGDVYYSCNGGTPYVYSGAYTGDMYMFFASSNVNGLGVTSFQWRA